ncbi:hypothetical protein VTL71DRAFT_9361 [Oculimacula yallundae]|uniref:Heterokaryon incompatibility domain-containing protein n=1 Tax=Oculimacula yallundae TaxID=86028 RepID=A0ABR4BT03_9HELO
MYYSLHPQEIRLVDILPGIWKDEIQCVLRHVSVANCPSYKALSYVWGASKGTRRSVTVDGHPHLVTFNLENALRRIRQPDVTITFWIDALSINQADNRERSTQVEMMRDIYAKASKVVIYLGEAPGHEFAGSPTTTRRTSALSIFYGDSKDAGVISEFQSLCLGKDLGNGSRNKKKLNYAHEACCLISLLAQTSDLGKVPPFDKESRPRLEAFYQRNVFEALRYLMRSSWWNRIWVVQEIVVPKNIILLYDTTKIPWEMFVSAAQSYTKNSFSPEMLSFPREYSDVLSFFCRIVLDIHSLRCQWEKNENTNLLSLLRQFSIRKASDDRDKVYALLGLVTESTESETPIISPDYTLDTVTVFKNTVLGIIESTGSLSILTGDLGRKNRQDLPSWAVDWSATSDDIDRRRAEDTEIYDASAGKGVRVVRSGDNPHLGLSKYLEQLQIKLEQEGVAVAPRSSVLERYNVLLSTADWQDYSVNPGKQFREPQCLEAIQNYLTIHGSILWLRESQGILDCPSIYKGRVVTVGRPSFTNDNLDSLVQDWAQIVYTYHDIGSKHAPVKNLDQAFVRTLCADIIHPERHMIDSKQRRANDTEKEEIATWILHQEGLQDWLHLRIWGALSSQHADVLSVIPPQISDNIKASIQTATFRRRLFITDTGVIGIGPAGLQRGDSLHLIPGGKAPFILREAAALKVPLVKDEPSLGRVERPCFSLVGDCYADGLMDGEGLETWRNAAMKAFEISKAQSHASVRYFEQWESINNDVSEGHTVVKIMKTPGFRAWLSIMQGTGTQDTVPEDEDNYATGERLARSHRSFMSIDDEVSGWLKRTGLMTRFMTNSDVQDCVRIVEFTMKRLEENLILARDGLSHTMMDLETFELESKDRLKAWRSFNSHHRSHSTSNAIAYLAVFENCSPSMNTL